MLRHSTGLPNRVRYGRRGTVTTGHADRIATEPLWTRVETGGVGRLEYGLMDASHRRVRTPCPHTSPHLARSPLVGRRAPPIGGATGESVATQQLVANSREVYIRGMHATNSA